MQGSAEVIFVRRGDAFQALKRYNNVQLDGKPMKVEIIGVDAGIPVSARVNVFGGANGRKRTVVMTSGAGRPRGGHTANKRDFMSQIGRGGSNNGRGGGRGRPIMRGRKKIVVKSAGDLDKELDSYHAEAMQRFATFFKQVFGILTSWGQYSSTLVG